MFAEERGSSARKRQDEARARRRKLKQEQDRQSQKEKLQQQKEQQKAAPTEIAATTGDPSQKATKRVDLQQHQTKVTNIPIALDSATKNSTVANALQQRQLRQKAYNSKKAAVTIESIFRAYHSNAQVIDEETTLLKKRLKDLATLCDILKQKTNADYIAPPATSTALMRQFLFIAKSNPASRSRRVVKFRNPPECIAMLQKLLQLAFLPGLYSPDENQNAIMVWLQSLEGKRRFQHLLQTCFVAIAQYYLSAETSETIYTFLGAVLVPSEKVDTKITDYARGIIIRRSKICLSSVEKVKGSSPAFAHIGNHLDAISVLSYVLLYKTGGPNPIPPASTSSREACIPQSDKNRADGLAAFVLRSILSTKSVLERRILLCRFVSEILTIPLLSWKLPNTFSKLVDRSTISGIPTASSKNAMNLVVMIHAFLDTYKQPLSLGEVDSVLDTGVSLIACPATPSQCLLANLTQLFQLSPTLNAKDARKLDFASASFLMKFVATLVDAVPLGTYLSKESVVEWISDGNGQHSPVVLSSIIMEQCRLFLLDTFVRRIFCCAMNESALNTQSILAQKTEKDKKQEKALQDAGTSAAVIAAKDARNDRNRGWNASGWARKLSKGVSKMMNSGTNGGKPSATQGKLMNTSQVSRALAEKGGGTKTGPGMTTEFASEIIAGFSSDLLFETTTAYAIVLSRWGGDGGKDIINRAGGDFSENASRNEKKKDRATTSADPNTKMLLNTLCFSTPLVRVLWGIIQSDPSVIANVYAIIDPSRGRQRIRSLDIRPTYLSESKNTGATLLFLFSSALNHALIITDDSEIYEMDQPIPLHQLRRAIQTLKQLVYRACCVDNIPSNGDQSANKRPNYFGLALIASSSRSMRDLYDRSSRRPMCASKLWLVEDLMEAEMKRCKTHEDYVRLLLFPVLKVCPFLVPFKRRLRIFERIVYTNRIDIQGENSPNPFNTNPLKPGRPVRIMRGRVLEDGLATLNNLGKDMRQRLAVQYINEAGVKETGVDAGGLFKEFWVDLCAIAFNPNYALFRVTEGADNCMYPSPSAASVHGSDHIILFEFLGRILGKALFESITISPVFSHSFLSFMRGDYNYLHMLPDLSTIDAQLYNNLMFLKTNDGDAEDLCLTFSVTVDDFGGNREVNLVPNGSNIDVTNQNKHRYIGLVAKYYVVDRVKVQSEAFTRGLWEVIDRSWLQLFNEPELQVLISGATGGQLDVDDLRSNSRYAGGFTGLERTVSRFWNVVASFTPKQQADLLRFVTSCERPPPLGFETLNPPFTIQRVGITKDADKLPSASTCFNVLKLPTYSSEKVMKERLLYAIEAGAGFELT